MENITISKEKYEELLRKAQKLEELQNQENSEKEIKTIEDLPEDLKEEMELLSKASAQSSAEFFAKHNL